MMTDRDVSTGADAIRLRDREPQPGPSARYQPTAGDVLPLVPNAVATIITFLFAMALPWACFWLVTSFVGEEGLVGDLAAMFMTATLRENAVLALGTALLCLVIGMVVQFRQHHRPFSNGWPIVLAFPVFWLILLPEFLLRQSPLYVWLLFGTAMPLVFCVHWMTVVAAREAME